MSMKELAHSITEWRKTKGFRTPSSIEQDELMLGKLMLVVTEVAEAAEAVRHQDFPNFKEEIADTFIRLLDICGTMEIDPQEIIDDKMKINWERTHLHGKISSV